MVTRFSNPTELLTGDITALSRQKTVLARRFIGDILSKKGDGREAIDITPATTFAGSIGPSFSPRSAPSPKFTTPRPEFEAPEFEAPEFDERRARGITQELAAPGLARLRRQERQDILSARADNPQLQALRERAIGEKFAGFRESILRTAQEGGFRQATIELGLEFQEAQANFQAALAEKDKIQRQMFAAEQAGDERAFQKSIIELTNQNAILADQQDFLQLMEAQSITFENQFIRDILSSLPRATGTGERIGGKPVLTFKSPSVDNGLKKSGNIASEIETFFL